MLLNHFPQVINRTDTDAPSDFQRRLALRELRSSHAGPITLDVAAGECVAIIGESGSGKSVFLRMIADLDPCSGEVLLDGTARETWTASTWRSMVVYQPAEPAWWEPTVEAHFSARQHDFARDLLPALNLKPEVWNAEIARLSTGERQRLALIRSLACKPKVLLLDEPAASLDLASTTAMEALLQTNLSDGMSIIIVTHSAQQAERLARRQLRMVHGQLEQT
jgi:ABC-type iron transport system FetAB ATPase subunit